MKISSIKSTKFISNVKNSSKAHNYIKKIFMKYGTRKDYNNGRSIKCYEY